MRFKDVDDNFLSFIKCEKSRRYNGDCIWIYTGEGVPIDELWNYTNFSQLRRRRQYLNFYFI